MSTAGARGRAQMAGRLLTDATLVMQRRSRQRRTFEKSGEGVSQSTAAERGKTLAPDTTPAESQAHLELAQAGCRFCLTHLRAALSPVICSYSC
jgi:hypothetical protein